jgi:cytochrome c oxidase cbb3-type subunit 3
MRGSPTLLLSAAAIVCATAASRAPQQPQPAAPSLGRAALPARQIMGAGPGDRPAVNEAAAQRGKVTWTAECAGCHGPDARGTPKGSNLVRSTLILHDRNGSDLGPVLKKGHPTQSGKPSASFTDEEIGELGQFLRQRVNDSFRGSPLFTVRNVLTGDPKAGADFFNGPGRCGTCHSTTGDLAGIGRKYEPVDLQQRMVFPGGGRGGRGRGGRGMAAEAPSRSAATVTVTPASGQPVSGVLVEMNDFTVTLRDPAGVFRTFTRTPTLAVAKTDPLAAHRALLDTLTDKNMHDLVAYLETLK